MKEWCSLLHPHIFNSNTLSFHLSNFIYPEINDVIYRGYYISICVVNDNIWYIMSRELSPCVLSHFRGGGLRTLLTRIATCMLAGIYILFVG